MKLASVLFVLLLLASPVLAQPQCEDCGGGGCQTISFSPETPGTGHNGVLLKYVDSTCTTLTLDVMIRNWYDAKVPDVMSIDIYINPYYATLSGYSTAGSWFLTSSSSINKSVEVYNSNGTTQVYANRGNCQYFCSVGSAAPFSGDRFVARLTYSKVHVGASIPITYSQPGYVPVLYDDGGACDCLLVGTDGWVAMGTVTIH